jgi:hypothetical protein
MAHTRWRRDGAVQIDLDALEALMLRIQFKLANADIKSGYVFALPQPGKKYDERKMSILISWSPRRLDGYMVEIRSNEVKSKPKTTCDKLAKLIADDLAAGMGC